MASKFAFLIAAATLGGCATQADQPDRGLASVNVPVVQRTDYVFDIAAPDGTVSPIEQARLDAWFRGLDLGYGDSVYVDGPYADSARADVARVAGTYGMLVQSGAPVTVNPIAPGLVRVVVARTKATVPNCPNWSVPAQPNHENRTMSTFGCGVNSNLAAMVANPQDLVHGREGTGVVDAATAARAVQQYRNATPTGTKGLQDISTKE